MVGDGPPVYANVRTRDKTDLLNEDLDPVLNGVDGRVPSISSLPSLIPPVGLKAEILSSTTAVVYWSDTTFPTSQVFNIQYRRVPFSYYQKIYTHLSYSFVLFLI